MSTLKPRATLTTDELIEGLEWLAEEAAQAQRRAILGGKTPEERAAIIRRKYHRDRYAAEKAAREAASA